MCRHIKLPENYSVGDFKEALTLFQDFDTKYESYHNMISVAFNTGQEIGGDIDHMRDAIVDETFQKLVLLDDASKEVFRQLLISGGMQIILSEQEGGFDFFQLASSTTPDTSLVMMSLAPLIYLIVLIENGDGSSYSQVNHTMACPREMVKFFSQKRFL
jgi:hypothetical protein